MIKTVIHKGKSINYNFEYKKVKNINIRIKSDGTVNVSAGRFVPISVVDDFVLSKFDFIQNALNKYESSKNIQNTIFFEDDELKNYILSLCRQVYPYFESKGIKYPKIKFRQMVSRWGTCHAVKGVLTFNTYLAYAPKECIDYVVWHEFTHFLQPNHSKLFYDELEKNCPQWKMYRKQLKSIIIPKN